MKLFRLLSLIIFFSFSILNAQGFTKNTKNDKCGIINNIQKHNSNEVLLSLKEGYTLNDFYISLYNYFNGVNAYTKKNIDISNFSLEKHINFLKVNKNYTNSHKDILLLKSQSLSSDELIKLAEQFESVETIEKNAQIQIQAIPNDSLYDKQWNLDMIQAPKAWEVTKGSNEVVVGIIDSGIDYKHADLKDNIWVNEVEQNGYAGVDDDGNGYIDDIHGIDTYYNDSDPQNGIQTHGTHVAGIIGASSNNAQGVAGVNWNVKIATCKFLNYWGYGTMANAIECVNYFNTLKEKGINIVATNNSWGWITDGELLKDAIKSARDLDIVMAAAAGNNAGSNDKLPIYPASTDIDNIISVGATNSDDHLAWFSNYGSNVDIAAPGDDVYSTIDDDKYDYKSGTSMATPHITGAVALLSAIHPEYSYKEKIEAIYNSADTVEAFDGKIVKNRRLNLANLVGASTIPDDGGDDENSSTPDNGSDEDDDKNNDDIPLPTYEKNFPEHQYITTNGIEFNDFDTANHTITEVRATLNGSLFSQDAKANIDITSSKSFNAYVYSNGMNKIVSCVIENNIIKVKGAYISFGNYTRDGRMYSFKVATSDRDRYIGIHTLTIIYK